MKSEDKINAVRMSGKVADAIQLLQTVHVNLDDYMNNVGMGVTRREMEGVLGNQLQLLEDAIHALGGVAK